MAATLTGVLDWEGGRGDDGHRDFDVTVLYNTSDANDGPQTVMACPDNYQIGDVWNLGNDFDEWAVCTPYLRVRPVIRNEPGRWWTGEFKFTTRQQLTRCQDTPIEDPLLEPPQISGSFVKYTQERYKDRNGGILQTTAFEQLRGPQVEFDANRPTVTIGMNLPVLGLDTFASMVDTVNDSAMWGLPARTVKLSNVSWTRYILGTCDYYYQRVLDFDIDYNTWDRFLLNEGTKVLFGHHDPTTKEWVLDNIGDPPAAPNPNNPEHYIRYKDPNDENARVILDVSTGKPITEAQLDADDPAVWTLQYRVYSESNFFILGIPSEF